MAQSPIRFVAPSPGPATDLASTPPPPSLFRRESPTTAAMRAEREALERSLSARRSTVKPVPVRPGVTAKPPAALERGPLEMATDFAGDSARSLLGRGTIGTGEGAVGLANIATALSPVNIGARAASALLGEKAPDLTLNPVLDAVGYQPQVARDYISEFDSEALKRARAEVEKAQGFLPTVEASLRNPSTIVQSAIESVPSMLAGQGVASGALKVAPGMAPILASALGEGALTAGQNAEQTRQESGTLTPGQAGAAVAAGGVTAGISRVAGRLAEKAGLADPDTLILAGRAASEKPRGLAARMIGGAISEGLLEEAPQSAQEQAFQNLAQGRPLGEGVMESAAQGMLTGGLMGAGSNVMPQRQAESVDNPDAPPPQYDAEDDFTSALLNPSIGPAQALAMGETAPPAAPPAPVPAPAPSIRPSDVAGQIVWDAESQGRSPLSALIDSGLSTKDAKAVLASVRAKQPKAAAVPAPDASKVDAEQDKAAAARRAEAKSPAPAPAPASRPTPRNATPEEEDRFLREAHDAVNRAASEQLRAEREARAERFATPWDNRFASGAAPAAEAPTADPFGQAERNAAFGLASIGSTDVSPAPSPFEAKQEQFARGQSEQQQAAEDAFYRQYAQDNGHAALVDALRTREGLSTSAAVEDAKAIEDGRPRKKRKPKPAQQAAPADAAPSDAAGTPTSPQAASSSPRDASAQAPDTQAQAGKAAAESSPAAGTPERKTEPHPSVEPPPTAGESSDAVASTPRDNEGSNAAQGSEQVDDIAAENTDSSADGSTTVTARGRDFEVKGARIEDGRRVWVLRGKGNPKFKVAPAEYKAIEGRDGTISVSQIRDDSENPFGAVTFENRDGQLRVKEQSKVGVAKSSKAVERGTATPDDQIAAALEASIAQTAKKPSNRGGEQSAQVGSERQPAVSPADKGALLEGPLADVRADDIVVRPPVEGSRDNQPVADNAPEVSQGSAPQSVRGPGRTVSEANPQKDQRAKQGDEGGQSTESLPPKAGMEKQKALFVQIGNRRFEVESFEDASKRWGGFRDKVISQGTRGADLPNPIIVDQDGTPVGRIAQNGKVFPPSDGNWRNEVGQKPLYDPSEAEPKEGQKYEFSSTQADLPPAFAAAVRSIAAKIPDSALAGDGRESDPHVTVKFGTTTNDAADVRKVLEGQGPITITFGKLSTFPPSESSDGAAVLKLDIYSSDLQALNKRIGDALDNTETFKYSPHVTVAYVDPAQADAVKAKLSNPLNGKTVKIDRLSFSDRQGEKHEIKLVAEPKGMDGLTKTQRAEKKTAPKPQEQAREQIATKLREPAKVTETKVAPATPEKAAEKVADQVERVIDTEGVKSAKAVHERVLAALQEEREAALKTSPFKEITYQALGVSGGSPNGRVIVDGVGMATVRSGELKWDESVSEIQSAEANRRAGVQNAPKERRIEVEKRNAFSEDETHATVAPVAKLAVARELSKGAGNIRVQIPGDGTFTIARNPEAIRATIERIKKGGPQPWKSVASYRNAGQQSAAKPAEAAKPAPAPAPAPEAPKLTGLAARIAEANQGRPLKGGDKNGDRRIKDAAKRADAKEEAEAAKADPKKSIGDVGEKIGGAKKDLWSTFKDKMSDALGMDLVAQPLSKSWPEPDYEAMIRDGADPWSVGFIRAVRDEVPPKPQKAWRAKQWAGQVEQLRKFAFDLLNGRYTKAQLQEKIAEKPFAETMKPVTDRAELYALVGHEKSLLGVRIASGDYSVFNGQKFDKTKTIWTVEKKAPKTSFSNWPKIMASGDTRAEALDAFKAAYPTLDVSPKKQAADFIVYSYRGKPGFYIGKKISGKTFDLAGPFDNVKEARAYKDAEQDALLAKLEKIKDVPLERRPDNRPRVGEDHRQGKDITADEFKDAFGFRGVEFGNWVEQGKRQASLNEAYDALMDMAAILDIPPKAISLNGELGLAFGARGGGQFAAAHYESGKVVINLTKTKGAGSLGHEWWHALDNYFSRTRGAKDGFMTTSVLNPGGANGDPAAEKVRIEMLRAYGQVRDKIRETALKARASKLDAKRSGKAYWTTGHEMSARAFESYLISKLQDQNGSNDYLANIVDEDTWNAAASMGFELSDSYPYPTAGEIPSIRAAFDNFFDVIESKETDKGVALFERRLSSGIEGERTSVGILPGDKEPSSLERKPHVSLTDAKAVRDVFQGDAFRMKGLGGLDVPTRDLVLNTVLAMGKDLKVRGSVVELVPVDVVNVLRSAQLPPEMLLHDPSVLEIALSTNRDLPVSTHRDVADALMRVMAVYGAELHNRIAANGVVRFGKRFFAVKAPASESKHKTTIRGGVAGTLEGVWENYNGESDSTRGPRYLEAIKQGEQINGAPAGVRIVDFENDVSKDVIREMAQTSAALAAKVDGAIRLIERASGMKITFGGFSPSGNFHGANTDGKVFINYLATHQLALEVAKKERITYEEAFAREAVNVLIHEAAHYAEKGHGPAFEAEMDRIKADLGAQALASMLRDFRRYAANDQNRTRTQRMYEKAAPGWIEGERRGREAAANTGAAGARGADAQQSERLRPRPRSDTGGDQDSFGDDEPAGGVRMARRTAPVDVAGATGLRRPDGRGIDPSFSRKPSASTPGLVAQQEANSDRLFRAFIRKQGGDIGDNETKGQYLQRKTQNRLNRLDRAESDAREKRGDTSAPILADRLFGGQARIDNKLTVTESVLLDPLMKSIRSNGLNSDLLGSYMQGKPDAIESVQKSGKRAKYDEAAAKIDAIYAVSDSYRIKRGLVTPEEMDDIRAKREKARAASTAHPIFDALQDFERVIIQDEHNTGLQAVAAFAEEANDPGFARVSKVGQDGPRPNSVVFRRDGREWQIDFSSPEVADSVRKLHADSMNAVARFVSKGTRWVSRVNTVLSPAFMIKNKIRDFAGSVLSAMVLQGAPNGVSKSVAAKIISGQGAAMRGTRDYIKNPAGKFEQGSAGWWAQQAHKNAAVPGYFRSIESLQRLESRLGDTLRGKMARKISFRHFSDVMMALSELSEASTRVSVYRALVESGVSPAKAGDMARQTLDTNKTGDWTRNIGAITPFFNSSVQGAARLAQMMTSKDPGVRRRARAMMGGLVAAGAMLGAWLAASGGDDDKDGIPDSDQQPEWDTQRNLIIGGVKIPLPQGFSAPFYAGFMLSKLGRGNAKPAEAMFQVGKAFWDQFTPISSPFGVAQPAADLLQNQTFTGAPIRPIRYPGDTRPNSEKFFKSNTGAAKAIAKGLNRATFGDESESGYIDFYPGDIDYVAKAGMGSFGRFMADSARAVEAIMDGKPVKKIPVVGDFLVDEDRNIQSRYYDAASMIRDADDRRRGKQRMAMRQELSERYPGSSEKIEGASLTELRKAMRDTGATLSPERGAWLKAELEEQDGRALKAKAAFEEASDRLKALDNMPDGPDKDEKRRAIYEAANRAFVAAVKVQ